VLDKETRYYWTWFVHWQELGVMSHIQRNVFETKLINYKLLLLINGKMQCQCNHYTILHVDSNNRLTETFISVSTLGIHP